jgi:hypothetical protein
MGPHIGEKRRLPLRGGIPVTYPGYQCQTYRESGGWEGEGTMTGDEARAWRVIAEHTIHTILPHFLMSAKRVPPTQEEGCC